MSEEIVDTGSLLGKGAVFHGKLTFLGTVRIEGSFEGEIRSDDTLVVAAGGEVRGSVQVGHLIITGGRVDAEVVATQSVELLPDGELNGQVTTPSFQIEKGAIFHGQSIMPRETSDQETESIPDSSPEEAATDI